MTKHNLKYDITDLEEGESVLAKFPELGVYGEFQEEDERWLKYVIYSQDKGSAFLRIQDIAQRREQAMTAAGFSKARNGAWSDERCEKAMLLQDEKINAMIWRYLRSVIRSEEFALYMSLSEMIWQDTLKIRMPIEGDKETDVQRSYQLRSQLVESVQKNIEVKRNLEKKLFANDDKLKQLVTEIEEQAGDEEGVENYIKMYQQKGAQK